MTRIDKIHAALGILAALAALAWLVIPDGDGPDDPAAPVVCAPGHALAPTGETCVPLPERSTALDAPSVSRLTPPSPEPAIINGAPNLDRPVIEYFEDGSWRNAATGESGCTPGALCDQPLVTVMPDGTWTTPDGLSGCLDGYPCAS